MTIALVTSVQTPANSGANSSAVDDTGANLLIFGYSQFGGGLSVSDSNTNTWVELTPQNNAGLSAVIWYVGGTPTVGSGHTYAAGGSNQTGQVSSWSGLQTTPFDVENGANTSGPTLTFQAGSITPSANNTLIIANVTWNTYTGSVTIDSGFTIISQNTIGGGAVFGAATAYLIQSSAAAINPTWTFGSGVGAANISANIASFLGTGGGAALIPPEPWQAKGGFGSIIAQ